MTFKNLYSRNDLAYFLGIPYSKLTYVLYGAKVQSFYKTFEIPKKMVG
ncbi:MAG: hypothetical protein SPC22_04675 [Ruminococcus bromii]|nr:hypothetical protein [Ruminococcus bromii]